MLRKGLILICIVLCAEFIQAQETINPSRRIRNDQFVVKWKAGIDINSQLASLGSSLRSSSVRQLRKTVENVRTQPSVLDRIFIINVAEGTDIPSLCDSLNATGTVEYAEPIFQEQLLLTPNDPGAQIGSDQYYLENIHAYDAWETYTGDPSIVVGIIDTGSDLVHEDLASKYAVNTSETEDGQDSDGNGYVDDVLGYDFANNDNDPSADADTHGTRVAGIVGAATNNQIGIAGTGFNTRIVPLKIFSSINNQSGGSYESIQYAADNNYDVINLSWGSNGSYAQFNQDIINYAVLEKDVVVVAAAGNTDDDLLFYPAAYDNVLSVAALDPNDEKAFFATYSATVDVAAPGVDMYSTVNGNGYGIDNGSSYAAPLVAGVAALIRGRYPELSALEVAERIKSTTDPIYNISANQPYIGKLGTGRLNAFKALAQESFTQLTVSIDEIQQSNSELFFEDTVSFFINIENQKDPVFLLEATLGSSSAFVIPIDSTQTVGYLNTDEGTIAGPFSFKIAKSTPASTLISIYVKLTDESRHESFHAFDFETAPGYQTMKNDSLSFTVVDDGNLGYRPDGYFDGEGFRYQSAQTQKIGFYTHYNDSVLFDNIPEILSLGTVKTGFEALETIKPYANENSSSFFFTSFTDTAASLLIESYAVLWDSLPGSAIGLSYRISNQSADTIYNLRSGLFIDYDTQFTNSSSGTILSDSIAYVADSLQTHQGVHIVADSIFYTLVDVTELDDTLTVDAKKNLILSNRDSIGFDKLTNSGVIGGAFYSSLPPFESESFTVLMGAGDSLDHMVDQLSHAASRMLSFEESPLIDSLIYACVDGAYDLVPEAGYDFYFFADPLGTDTLSMNDSIRIEQITSDTIIYLSKVNSTGVSETIKAFQIELFDDIADFSFVSDTVFLGDHPENRVELTDQSIDPITWTWDFGNGILATGIQNPSPVFAETGVYDISLTIENIQGCSDLETKTLTVLERPEAPQLSSIGYCPEEPVHIDHQDTLLIYPLASSQDALFVGNSFQIGPLQSDTTVYISRIVGGIESSRSEVFLTENPTSLNLQITPNIDSLDGFWANFSFAEPYVSSVTWVVNSTQNTSNPAVLPIMSDSILLRYQVVTDSSCNISKDSTLLLSPSPLPDFSSFDICIGEDAIVEPTNGTVFGFYLDSLLTEPLSKGSKWSIDSLVSDTTIFVVGLDSLLPSSPERIDISAIDYQFDIITSKDSIYLNLERSIDFTVSSESEQVTWYVDSIQQAVSMSPTLFFTSPGIFEIVAAGTHPVGCVFTDSTQIYVFEEYVEPLSSEFLNQTHLFPVPTDRFLFYDPEIKIKSIRAFDLTGKQHAVSFDLEKVDITNIPKGLFFLEVEIQSGEILPFRGLKSTDE
jgi:PKD repeat protein